MPRINNNVGNVFGHRVSDGRLNISSPLLLTDDKVGIESELEGLDRGIDQYQQDTSLTNFWNVVTDDSLRSHGSFSACEFVFNEPMFGEDVIQALNILEGTINRTVDSERTSVHVHLDVRDMSYNQLLRLVINYLLVEPIIFSLAGEGREDNFYCTPLRNSTGYLRDIGRALISFNDNRDSFYSTIGNNGGNKYTALNLLPIAQQGSVEFRHMHGTCNAEEITYWINIILSLKRDAMEHNDLMTISVVDEIASNYKEYVSHLFRDNNIPDLDALIEKNEEGACLCAKQMFILSRNSTNEEGVFTTESKNCKFWEVMTKDVKKEFFKYYIPEEEQEGGVNEEVGGEFTWDTEAIERVSTRPAYFGAPTTATFAPIRDSTSLRTRAEESTPRANQPISGATLSRWQRVRLMTNELGISQSSAETILDSGVYRRTLQRAVDRVNMRISSNTNN